VASSGIVDRTLPTSPEGYRSILVILAVLTTSPRFEVFNQPEGGGLLVAPSCSESLIKSLACTKRSKMQE
jgi:hypothetical protein